MYVELFTFEAIFGYVCNGNFDQVKCKTFLRQEHGARKVALSNYSLRYKSWYHGMKATYHCVIQAAFDVFIQSTSDAFIG